MALNPFFLQGTASEQRLVQDLVNEHLQFHGVEVTYIPRKYVNRKTIIEEVQTSKFDDNFAIEAYVNNFDGYSGAGDILTKFGVSVRDELTLTISKEDLKISLHHLWRDRMMGLIHLKCQHQLDQEKVI